MSNTGLHVHSLSERAKANRRWSKDGAFPPSVMTGRRLGCWRAALWSMSAEEHRENGHLLRAHACSHVKGRREKSEVSFGAHMALQGIESTRLSEDVTLWKLNMPHGSESRVSLISDGYRGQGKVVKPFIFCEKQFILRNLIERKLKKKEISNSFNY